MNRVGIAAALLLCVIVPMSCSSTKYVPVCSEHGGIKTVTAPDHVDDFYTRDVLCKDGVTQRPEQVEDANGKFHQMVPSEH